MKKKGRYQHTALKEAKNRKYTSYEEAPLREYRDADPVPQNLTNKFLKVFGILFISVVAVLAIINLDNLTADNISHWFQYDLLGKTEGGGYPVRYNGIAINTGNFAMMDSSPVYCSDTSLVVLNSNAGEYQNTQHAFANPILKTNSNYSIVYNSDATGYKIIDRESTVYSGSASKKIFDADIASNGTFGILTYGNDYLSELNVYKIDGTKKFGYSFAEYYVNTVSINNKGTMAALGGVSAKNGGLTSAVYILDFGQDSYLQKHEFEDSFIYDIKYLDNGNVIAVGSEASYFIDVEANTEKIISYNMSNISNYTLNRSYGLILSLSTNTDGRVCEVSLINDEGKTDSTISINGKVLSLDYSGEKVAVLTLGNVSVYDLKGKKLAGKETGSDSKKACFYGGNTLYILSTSQISKITIEE